MAGDLAASLYQVDSSLSFKMSQSMYHLIINYQKLSLLLKLFPVVTIVPMQ